MIHIRTLIPALALAASAAIAAPAFASSQIVDGGFETQASTVANGGYCYFQMGTPGGPACGAGAWQGAGAGFQDETNQPWPGQPTGDGTKYGFVQGEGMLGQLFTATDSGLFSLSWMDAGRPASGNNDGNQTYDVILLSLAGNITLGSFATTNYQPFTARSVATPFALTSGQTYGLVFKGTGQGDHTSFIDAVSLTGGGVPEPATWGLMIMGFGGMGVVLRASRRRAAVAATA